MKTWKPESRPGSAAVDWYERVPELEPRPVNYDEVEEWDDAIIPPKPSIGLCYHYEVSERAARVAEERESK